MKFSTALALGLAPLSMARKVRNVYPPSRRDGHLVNGKEEHVMPPNEHVMPPNEHVMPPDEHVMPPDEHVMPPDEHAMPPAEHVAPPPAEHVSPPGNHQIVDEMKGHGFTAHAKTEIIIIWANPGDGAEKTTYNEKLPMTETGKDHPPAAAATHTVKVGGPDGLVYQPEQLENVPVGDMIVFEFLAQNHTVTQSGFDTPCEALEGGMDTGHQPNPDNSVVPAPQVAMQVTDSKPLWFYCKTGNHCGSGMVFSVNPTKEKTHAQFKEKAIVQNGEGEPTPITGGEPAKPDESAKPEAPPAGETPPADVIGGDEAAKPGKGVIGEDGSCHCMVSCADGSFPSEVQGVGATGGHAGSLPARMAGIV